MHSTDRDGFTAGLRAVASFLDDHPEVPLPLLDSHTDHMFTTMAIYLVDESTARAELTAIARAMGTANKAASGDRFQVYRDFHGIRVMAQAPRDQVCTRVVTGVEDREVEEVVTPAVVRKVRKPVEVVEWRCEPLLAPVADGVQEPVPLAKIRAGIAAGEPEPCCRDCGATPDVAPLQELVITGSGEARRDWQCWNHEACAARVATLLNGGVVR